MKLYRTLMFAPCARPELMAKAQLGQADALIFDLEDSVPTQAKELARNNLREALAQGLKKPAFVRVNHPGAGDCAADLAALSHKPDPLLAGVIRACLAVDPRARPDGKRRDTACD